MTRALTPHPDRLLPVDPAKRAIARRLYETVSDLPIISPHGHTDPVLATWFAQECRCPSSMVGRIVPAMTDADRAWGAGQTGLADDGAILIEAFTRWVTENDFAGPPPRLEATGIAAALFGTNGLFCATWTASDAAIARLTNRLACHPSDGPVCTGKPFGLERVSRPDFRSFAALSATGIGAWAVLGTNVSGPPCFLTRELAHLRLWSRTQTGGIAAAPPYTPGRVRPCAPPRARRAVPDEFLPYDLPRPSRHDRSRPCRARV